MLGLFNALIVEIIALTAASTRVRLALHKEVQTAELLRDWHTHSIEL